MLPLHIKLQLPIERSEHTGITNHGKNQLSPLFLIFSLEFYHISPFLKTLPIVIIEGTVHLCPIKVLKNHKEGSSLPVIAFRVVTFPQELQQSRQKNKGAE